MPYVIIIFTLLIFCQCLNNNAADLSLKKIAACTLVKNDALHGLFNIASNSPNLATEHREYIAQVAQQYATTLYLQNLYPIAQTNHNNILEKLQLTHAKNLSLHQIISIDCTDLYTQIIGTENGNLTLIKIDNKEFKIIQKLSLYPYLGPAKTITYHYPTNTLISYQDQESLKIGHVLPDGNYKSIPHVPTERLHGKINHITCNMDATFACSHCDGTVTIWKLNNQNVYECVQIIPVPKIPLLCAWKDLTTFACAETNCISIWRYQDSQFSCIQILPLHSSRITHLAWNHDGTILTSASDDLSLKFSRYNQLSSLYELALTIYDFEDFFTSVSWNKNYLVCGCMNHSIYIFENDELVQSIRRIGTLKSNNNCIMWGPDGSYLVTGSNEYKRVCFWNTYNKWTLAASYAVIKQFSSCNDQNIESQRTAE
jgi:WD40 repeat protein